jgi:hypothetical protein
MRLPTILGALLLCLAATTTALGAGLRQADEGGGEGGGVERPSIADDSPFTMPYDDVIRMGVPFQCGAPANPTRKAPEVACRIEATVSVPARVASFLHLSSRVLASGVASEHKDRFTANDETVRDRTYFLPISSAVKAKLKAKKVGAIGVTQTGTISIVGEDKVICYSESQDDATPPLRSSCPIVHHKKALIYGGQDGELLCWRYMPWWLATPVPHYGDRCPEPIKAS